MRGAVPALLALVAFFPSGAAEAACPPERVPSLHLSAYLRAYELCAAEGRATAVFEEQLEKTEEAVAARPASTGGSGFAGELRNTIEDFLPLFKIGVDALSTSEDGRSLDLRFNPIRAGRLGSVGLSARVTEPEAGAEFLALLPDARRSAVANIVDAEVGDFSDVTLTARWGYERTPEDEQVPRRMWGRNVERYRPIVEQWMAKTVGVEAIAHFRETQDVGACEDEIQTGLITPEEPEPQPLNATLAEIEAVLGPDRFAECLEGYEQERDLVEGLDVRLDAFALLPALIDNQPQLVLSLARHERDPLVGRSGWAGKLTYEHGFHNFNRLLGIYHGKARGSDDDEARARAFWEAVEELDLKKVKNEKKLTFSATYEEGEALGFSRTFGEGDEAVTATLDLPRRSELSLKSEYTRNATWHPMQVAGTTVFPRLHASFEYVDVSDDPARKDRGIARLTYELPITATIVVPLSLTYANRAEFLGEQDEELSAHLGFSYKLPWNYD